jgi:hypothetical protein
MPHTRDRKPLAELTGWYMARKDGQHFTAFTAESDAEAAQKIQGLQDACSDPTATFTFVPLREDVTAQARRCTTCAGPLTAADWEVALVLAQEEAPTEPQCDTCFRAACEAFGAQEAL